MNNTVIAAADDANEKKTSELDPTPTGGPDTDLLSRLKAWCKKQLHEFYVLWKYRDAPLCPYHTWKEREAKDGWYCTVCQARSDYVNYMRW